MIITRTPLRISFAGGGSDFPEFYKEEPGAIVSTSINKYIFLSMHPLFGSKGYFLKYSKNEIVNKVRDIQHPIIRQVFKEHSIIGVDFNSSSDVPAGTGLGSSSAFTVGLLNLCFASKCIYPRRENIAREACRIEITELGSPIGKQDQYACALGGLNYLHFNYDNTVEVQRLSLSESKLHELQKSLILLYLGESRNTESVLKEQNLKIEENREALRKLVRLAELLKLDLLENNLDSFGDFLHEGWLYKRELSKNITNYKIDYIYDLALKNGALGGKLLGAGKTGFFLLYAKEEDHTRIKKALRLYELPFQFEDCGTEVIYR